MQNNQTDYRHVLISFLNENIHLDPDQVHVHDISWSVYAPTGAYLCTIFPFLQQTELQLFFFKLFNDPRHIESTWGWGAPVQTLTPNYLFYYIKTKM